MSTAIVAAQLVVGGLEPAAVIDVERIWKSRNFLAASGVTSLNSGFRRGPDRRRTSADPRVLAGVADGIAGEGLRRFETGGIKGELRPEEVGRIEHEMRDLGFHKPCTSFAHPACPLPPARR